MFDGPHLAMVAQAVVALLGIVFIVYFRTEILSIGKKLLELKRSFLAKKEGLAPYHLGPENDDTIHRLLSIVKEQEKLSPSKTLILNDLIDLLERLSSYRVASVTFSSNMNDLISLEAWLDPKILLPGVEVFFYKNPNEKGRIVIANKCVYVSVSKSGVPRMGPGIKVSGYYDVISEKFIQAGDMANTRPIAHLYWPPYATISNSAILLPNSISIDGALFVEYNQIISIGNGRRSGKNSSGLKSSKDSS